jgi:DNA-binding NarL/FixJ family response regulator
MPLTRSRKLLKPKVLLVDDHHLVLDGLRLELSAEFEIVGQVDNGKSVVSECRRLAPDVVLLDLSLPDRDGFGVLADLRASLPGIKTLIVTMHCDPVLAGAALQAGARGFVPKDAKASELRHAVAVVIAGGVFVSPCVATGRTESDSTQHRTRLSHLTPRQQRIVWLIGEGKSTRQIADELHVCPDTVSFHRTRIRKSLVISTEFELTRYAIMTRLFKNSPSFGGA